MATGQVRRHKSGGRLLRMQRSLAGGARHNNFYLENLRCCRRPDDVAAGVDEIGAPGLDEAGPCLWCLKVQRRDAAL